MDAVIARGSEVLDAVSKVDAVKLRELAGYYTDEAAVSQGEVEIKMALATYCLHKIFIKVHMRDKVNPLVESVLKSLSGGDVDRVLADIEAFDLEHGLFEGGIVGKARIKIASRLSSRGISMTQSASLTGAGMGDMLEYAGETRGYAPKDGKTLAARLNIARDLFK